MSATAPAAPNTPRLSKEQRLREKALAVRATWEANRIRTGQLKAAAADELGRCQPDSRALWLMLGIFETEERHRAGGTSVSVKSVWFDRTARNLRTGCRGVSGFTSTKCRAYPQFLKSSGNGYAHLTDLGYALVQHLRDQFPALQDTRSLPQVIALKDFDDIPYPAWRVWPAPQPIA